MSIKNFYLIRHALVTEEARRMLYGRMDVSICAQSLRDEAALLAGLQRILPAEATYFVSPLRRTQQTLAALHPDGAARAVVEAGFTEQDLGDWQGLAHADLPAYLVHPAHPFWPLSAAETPPGGENMEQVRTRVGDALERIAETVPAENIIVVSHGGAIRAAIAHALDVPAQASLHLAIGNLSLTRMERHREGWRVTGVNELPGS
jgi:broad specificity phosphatase PhoE